MFYEDVLRPCRESLSSLVIARRIHDHPLIFAIFPMTIFWILIWIYRNRGTPGWLLALRRHSAFGWVSMRQDEASHGTMEERHIDGVSGQNYDSNIMRYYGTDQTENFLFIQINRRQNKPNEMVLFLRLEDGRFYELPDHPSTVVNTVENSALKISVLQSSKRTRIVFNGLLRQGNRTDVNYSTDDDIEHVRFNCIFIAYSKPYLQKEYWSPNLLVETLKRNCCSKSKWKQFSKNLNIDQADQYGSLMTEIMFENSSSKQLYLHCMRQYQRGIFDATYFNRNVSITATDTLGTFFHLRSFNLKDGLKCMQLGHVKDATDELHPVESLDFQADQLFDRYHNGFDEYAFQFTAGKRKYEARIKLNRKTLKALYGGDPWDSQHTYCQFELKLNDHSGVGMIEIMQPYSGECPMNLITASKRAIKSKASTVDEQDYILLFEDERCQVESLVGGKGASLAELTALEMTAFTVPKGFCVTAKALKAHIDHHANLTKTIDEFVDICCGKIAGDIEGFSQIVVAALQNTTMLRTVQSAIMETFKKLECNSEKHTYAVRSSAVGEDSEDTSAAGQNSTFLGIESADEVVKFVAHCWASLYTYQSVEYRRQHGLPIKASMGVCVQRMVNAESAGVLFTRHPITGNPKEILITSNYGLGESVVSALVDPDTIIIQQNLKNSLSVKSLSVGKKSQKVIVNASAEGTIRSNVSDSDKYKLSINEQSGLKLAEIGVTLDQLYNAPKDIEWAIVGERIYLLQCRPITALDAWTDFELTHELGSGVPSGSDILTRANVGEVLPAAGTPLSNIIASGINISMESSRVRRLLDDTYKRHLFVANWKIFLNYMSLFLLYPKGEITLVQKVIDIALCGHPLVTPEINEMSVKRNGGTLTRQVRFKLTWYMIADFWNNSRKIDEAETIVKRCRLGLREAMNFSVRELYEWLGELGREYVKVSLAHSLATRCNILSEVFVMMVLAEGNRQLTMEHYSDIGVLLGSCSDAISAKVPLALKEIAETIRQSRLSEDFKKVDASEALSWLLNNCPKAHEQAQKFIEVHGHRGIGEFELMTETWGMKPEKFLSTVQLMLNSTTDISIKTTGLSSQETVALLKTPKKSSTRWLISKMLPWMQRTVARREQTKCLLTELVHLMRLGYRKLAEILVREGCIPEQELIFFFTHEDLDVIIRGPCPSLMRKAVRRRRLIPKLDKHKYNEVIRGMPMPIEVPKVPASIGGARIQGTSVCNGVATGRACVATSLEDAGTIQPGDILITHATDIGWSPYFPLLAGVVTELGGLISHGAVVAREYGLPCIVGAENATATFKTGDSVKLDGYAGIIEAVEAM